MNYIFTRIYKTAFLVIISLFLLVTVVGAQSGDQVRLGSDGSVDQHGVQYLPPVSGDAVDNDCDGYGDDGCSANKPVACTMDAKVCPDGSSVGRTGPNCEFSACPGEGEGERKVDAYIKIDDVKGESKSRVGGDEVGDGVGKDSDDFNPDLDRIRANETAGLDTDDDNDGVKTTDTERNATKTKERVVVGEQIRAAIAEGKEVRGWDPVKKEVVLRISEIKSEDDVTDYANAVLASNPNLKSIAVRERGITIDTASNGKFLGLFSVAMDVEVEVSDGEEGKVKVKMPWWSFLVKKDVPADRLIEKIEAELVLNEEGVGQLQTVSNMMKVANDVLRSLTE